MSARLAGHIKPQRQIRRGFVIMLLASITNLGLKLLFQTCAGSLANALVAGVVVPLVMHSTTWLAAASFLMMAVGLLAWIWVKPQVI